MTTCVNCRNAQSQAIITVSGASLLEYTPNPKGYVTGDLPNGVHVLDRVDPNVGLVKSGVQPGCVVACDAAHPGKVVACQWPAGLTPAVAPSYPFYHCGGAPPNGYSWLTSCFWIGPPYGDVILNSMSATYPSERYLVYWRYLHFVVAWVSCDVGPDDISCYIFLVGLWEQEYPVTQYNSDWAVHTRLVVSSGISSGAQCSQTRAFTFYPCWIWPLPQPPVPPYRWGNYIYPTDPQSCGWPQCYTDGSLSLTWAN